MTTVTPNLKLNVPAFDQSPWDTDVDQNWLILDATVGQFFGVTNFVGVWLNNQAYLVGQNVVDGSDSSMWMCLVPNTSGAVPQTFAQYRTANPTHWTQTGASAADSAQTASNAASAAAVSANAAAMQAGNAANSATSAAASATTAGSFVGISVPLAGGVMTGPLTLNADPTIARGAATKQYVDARVGGTGFLPTTGGTLTGFLTLNADPTALLHAATKQYVDGHITSAVGAYLPLAGGTLTGALVTGAFNITANAFVLNNGGGYFFSNGSVSQLLWDASNWRLNYTRSSGVLQYLRGSDSAVLWQMDGSGNETVAGQISSGSNIVAAGNTYARAGTNFIGSTDRSYFSTNSSTFTTVMFRNDGYQLNWSWADGVWRFYNSSSAICFAIDPAGNASCPANFSTGGSMVAASNVQAGNAVFANNTNMVFGPSGTNNIIQMANNWYWRWVTSSGEMNWVAFGTVQWSMRASDWLCWNAAGVVGGFGAYQNLSDERVKTAITKAQYGLPEILQINPITFKRIPRAEHIRDMPEEVGFSAQQLAPILPHAVRQRVVDDEDMMFIDSDVIIAALVNAVKTLEQRISAMENK
jgi:hypothetical protein